MPGYDDQVIMAAGAFVQGASIELSADAPMREPYVCYMQGGLTYSSGKAASCLRPKGSRPNCKIDVAVLMVQYCLKSSGR